MKAISIRQPWAWAIIHAGKRIENREWRGAPSYRGPILIHAAQGCTSEEYRGAAAWMAGRGLIAWKSGQTPRLPKLSELERGGFVGRAYLVDVIRPGVRCSSPWYLGALGLVLADVEALPFTPYRGEFGLFDVPDTIDLRGLDHE